MLATTINAMVRARVKLYNEGAVTKSGKKKYRVHYDSDHKLLGQLNNVYMTRFKDGWIFDEVAGKKKELFRILNVPLPTCEQVIMSDDQQEDPDEIADIEDIAAETVDPEVVEL